MKAHYELKNPRKNPFAERMKNGYRIIIDRGPIKEDELDNEEDDPTEDEITTLNKYRSAMAHEGEVRA